MLRENWAVIEPILLNLGFAAIFLLIGLSIQDVLKKGNVPPFGRAIVWLVLFLGCAGFVIKGIIQFAWQSSGVGS